MSKETPALVDSAWLATRLGDPALRILDASYFVPGGIPPALTQYQNGHIPGAQFFDINAVADRTKRKEHAFPPASVFAEKVAALGIGNRHHVIAYDHLGGTCAAARVWFMFRAFGHGAVSVLDGGRDKWNAEGRTMTPEVPEFPDERFVVGEHGDIVRSEADIFANVTRPRAQIVDARSAGRFTGSEPEPRPGLRAGHIPGSLNLPFLTMLEDKTRTWKTPEDLRRLFVSAGVDLDRPVITTCGSGVSACALALGAYLCGKTDVAIYDGSWIEWGADLNLPVEKGPPHRR